MRVDPLTLDVDGASQTIRIGSVAGARFSSRDVAATRRALDEQIGKDGYLCGATKTNPSLFQIGRYLLTQASEFEVQGPLTGGEAEVVAILLEDGEVLVSVGSDQCDRELDMLFPDKPKQMCPHPIATAAWRYAQVREHWDQLQITSDVLIDGHAIRLQDSTLSALVDLEYLLSMDAVKRLPRPAFLYGGACPFLERAAEQAAELGLPESVGHGTGDGFVARLHDPVLDRTIEHRFSAVVVGDDLSERINRPRR